MAFEPLLTLDLTFKSEAILDQDWRGFITVSVLQPTLIAAKLTREDGLRIFDISTDTGAINLDKIEKLVRYAVLYGGNACQLEINVTVI